MNPYVGPDRPRRTWVILAGAVVVLAAVVVGAYLIVRPKHVSHAGEIVGFTAPPTPTVASSSAPPKPLNVVILRGGETGCRTTGGCNDANYTQILAYKEGWNVTVLAKGGTGYLCGNLNKPATNYASQLPALYKANPGLVIVEGSANDAPFSPAGVRAAATALYTDIHAKLPLAKIVVVGPAWGGTPPKSILATEAAVKAAAAGRVALFIDPIAQGWFSGKNASLMAPDHVSPTDAGHTYMATEIQADLAPLHL